MNKNYLKLLATNLILTPIVLTLFSKLFSLQSSYWSTWLIMVFIVSAVVLAIKAFDTDNTTDIETDAFSIKFRTYALILIGVLGVSLFIKNVSGEVAVMHNTAVRLNGNYGQKTEGLKSFYDMQWKTYKQLDKNATVSKDVFLEVAKICMENRKDGEFLSWKWVQENQQIPFNEFTKFYTDLSRYIETKRGEYYLLEVERQELANEYNIYLDTFPNNLYNVILQKEHIKYEQGFLSDSTNTVFSSKIENL